MNASNRILSKSKKSAVIMGCIFLVPVIVIAVIVGQVRYASLPTPDQNPNVVNGFAGVGPALMAAAILILSLGLVSFIIYQLNESHYGRQGATRWAAAGIIYGALQQVVLTPVPSDFDFSAGSIIKQIGGDLLWKVLSFLITYLLAFPVFNRIQNLRHSP